MAAGAATKTGVIGYVVPFAIPEVIRHANAFALGAQATHPGAKVKLVWTKSWLDPDKEKQGRGEPRTSRAAPTCSARTSTARPPASTPRRRASRGSATTPTRKSFAPKSWLTAAVYNWGPYYLKRVKAAMAGTWKTGSYYGTFKDGFIDLAPYGPGVSAKTKAAIAAKRAAITKGTFYEFQGPIYDQAGKLRVPKGKKLSLGDILGDELARQGRRSAPPKGWIVLP